MRFFAKQWALLMGSAVLLTPAVASAAALTSLTNLVNAVAGIVDILIPLLMALAVVAFFWGLIRFISKSGNPEEAKKGRGIMLWGIIVLFIMVAIWGLVQFIAGNLGVSTGGAVVPPSVDRSTTVTPTTVTP